MNKVALFSKEYPPYVYGGAGVHVEYLSQALAKRIAVEVRCFGDQEITGVAVLHGSGMRAQLPQPCLGSGDADVGRASELQHAVQDLDGDGRLGRPTLVRVRGQPVPDQALVAPNGCLGAGPLRVSGPLLPSHPALLGDELEMAVALCRHGLGRRAGHRRGARGYDNGRLWITLGDTGVDAVLVVGTVAGERGDRAVHLVQQGTNLS